MNLYARYPAAFGVADRAKPVFDRSHRTFRQPMEGMGTIAVNIIFDGINALLEKREVGVVHKRIAPELVVRESTRGLS